MSDYKAAFRAAAAQRSSSGKEALKALKVQKAVDKFSAASQAKAGAPASAALSAPPSTGPAPPPAAAGSRAPPPSGLPANFFSAPAGPSGRPAAPAAAPAQPAPAAQQPPARAAAAAPAPIVAAPRPAPPPTTQPAAAAAAGALPARFFEDKAADAKARGIKLPDAKDKEEEYREFQRMMDTQLREAAAKEAEEADAEAKEKEERDAFEFRLKMQRLEDLKSRKAPAPLDYELAAEPPPLAKRRRVMDALQEVQQAGSGGDSEGSEADDGVLDWRAKTL